MQQNNQPLDWIRINPARLRKWIDIQYQQNTVDGIGQQVQVWPTLVRVKAAIEEVVLMSSREFDNHGLISDRMTHVIVTRWPRNRQVTPGMRVLFVDQAYSPPAIHYYNIETVENVENRNLMLKLTCWEVNAVG